MTEKTSAVTVHDETVPPAYGPPLTQAKSERSSCKSKAMVGYSAGITVALIVVVIMGGIYYYKSMDTLQSTIQKFHEVYKNDKNEEVSQDTEVDKDKNIVVFRLRGKGIAEGTKAVFDYTKSMSGMVDPEAKECFVMGGIRKDMADAGGIEESFIGTNETAVSEALNFQKADDYPISDKSILPKPLQADCKYLPTYWMEPAPEDMSTENDDTTDTEDGSDVAKERSKRACYYRRFCYYRRRCYKTCTRYRCYYYCYRYKYCYTRYYCSGK